MPRRRLSQPASNGSEVNRIIKDKSFYCTNPSRAGFLLSVFILGSPPLSPAGTLASTLTKCRLSNGFHAFCIMFQYELKVRHIRAPNFLKSAARAWRSLDPWEVEEWARIAKGGFLIQENIRGLFPVVSKTEPPSHVLAAAMESAEKLISIFHAVWMSPKSSY